MTKRLIAIILYTLGVIIVTSGTVFFSRESWADLSKDTFKNLDFMALTYEEHLLRVFGEIDGNLLRLRQAVKDSPHQFNWEQWAASERLDPNLIVQMSIISQDGIERSTYYPDSRIISTIQTELKDRDFIREQLAGAVDQPAVSPPVKSAASGRWMIQISRKLTRGAHNAAGVVIISIDPYYFSSFYERTGLMEPKVAALIGTDGWIRSRSSLVDSAMSHRISEAFLDIVLATKAGQRIFLSGFTNKMQFTAFRTVQGWPLIVSVSHSYSDIASGWYRSISVYIAGAIALVILMTLLMFQAAISNDRLTSARVAQNKAQAASEFKSELLAVTAHELRTPLIGILDTVNSLSEINTDLSVIPYLDALSLSTEALLAKTDEIFDFSGSARYPVDSNVDVVESVALVVQIYEPWANSKGLRIHQNLDKAVLANVRGDKDVLSKVLRALISNAIKFSDSGAIQISALWVEVEGPLGLVEISVQDQGIGMEPEMLEYIFHPYFKVDTSATRESGGLGLGLYSAQRAAKSSGWSINVESVPGQGSKFTLQIPVAKSDRAPLLNGAIPPAMGDRTAQRILVVDDNQVTTMILAAGLEKAHNTVVQVHSGQAALDATISEPFDLIFMDLEMPHMSGFEATAKIREQVSSTKVPKIILMTASVQLTAPELAVLGFDGQIGKPFNWSEIGSYVS